MSRLTGWWDRRSDPARVELYTRWTFPFFALTGVVVIVGPLTEGGMSGWLRAGSFLLTVVQAALCALLSSRGLDWTLGRRPRPVRLFVAVGALSGGGALAALALRGHTGFPDAPAMALVVILVGFGVGAMILAVSSMRAMLRCLLGATAGTGLAAVLLGIPAAESGVIAVAVLLTGAVTSATNGCSVWLLSTVWELDAAREAQAQLAVAEERLRFGRDLHDVMGRNLAVIALKSELAVQLARRGRPEAVEQMIEVQRLAQESQREVRDVVRGYRRADLAVELSGALSVLRAAGVEGRVEGNPGDQGGRTLPAGVQEALGWVIREATTNVLRHSEAGHCTIRLELGGSAVLTVENDGVPEPAPGGAGGSEGSGGSGLAGLGERLTVLDGTLAVSRPGAGVFRLTVRIPLAAAVPAHRDDAAAVRAAAPAGTVPRKAGSTA
ncbi:sensor histidine kinase [Streptacidiphilus sp. N1-3]|uniref:Sensor histidine kinase n=1 Tax=Streptacidiphilus alkalitolerans TaxID=3342712 RepID=A0ABV6X6M9_9ACTN